MVPVSPRGQNLHRALKKSFELLRLHADTLRGPFLPFDRGNESGFSELHSIFVGIHGGHNPPELLLRRIVLDAGNSFQQGKHDGGARVGPAPYEPA